MTYLSNIYLLIGSIVIHIMYDLFLRQIVDVKYTYGLDKLKDTILDFYNSIVWVVLVMAPYLNKIRFDNAFYITMLLNFIIFMIIDRLQTKKIIDFNSTQIIRLIQLLCIWIFIGGIF